MKNKFEIDFFELSFLAEACIPPVPIARACFWDKLIDEYYKLLSPDERKNIYSWMNRNSIFEEHVKTNTDCQLFNARYNPDNQYTVVLEYYGKQSTYDCFLWEGNYHKSKHEYIYTDCIKEIIKK